MFSGGLSTQKEATAVVQQICDMMKVYAEQKAGRKFDIFTAKSYRTNKLIAGNYLIKVHVGGEQCVHLRVYQKQPCDGGTLELKGIQYPKSLQDHIMIFI